MSEYSISEDSSNNTSLSSSPNPSEEEEDSQDFSASFNLIFRASAALSRLKKSRGQNRNNKSNSDQSELKKLLLQKSTAPSQVHRLSSSSTSTFKKSSCSAKQHRSKKRFLIELNNRLGVVGRVSSIENTRSNLTKSEVGKNAALSSSLGELTKFVVDMGSITKQRPFVNALHEVLLEESPSCDRSPTPQSICDYNIDQASPYLDCWSPDSEFNNFSFDTTPSPGYDPNDSYTFPNCYNDIPMAGHFSDTLSDYGSAGVRSSLSEFSDFSPIDEVFDDIPSSPIDFRIGDDDMQKLIESLTGFEEIGDGAFPYVF